MSSVIFSTRGIERPGCFISLTDRIVWNDRDRIYKNRVGSFNEVGSGAIPFVLEND